MALPRMGALAFICDLHQDEGRPALGKNLNLCSLGALCVACGKEDTKGQFSLTPWQDKSVLEVDGGTGGSGSSYDEPGQLQ